MELEEKTVRAPSGREYIVEAWQPLGALAAVSLAAEFVSWLLPIWRVAVTPYPVPGPGSAVYRTWRFRTRNARQAVSDLVAAVERGDLPAP